MPSSKQILRSLRRIGYTIAAERGKGSHTIAYFEHQGKKVCITSVQKARDIPKGTLGSIRRAISLTDPEDFQKFMGGRLTRDEYVALLLERGIIEPGQA